MNPNLADMLMRIVSLFFFRRYPHYTQQMLDFIAIPDGLTALSFWALIIASCFTSMLTASLGIGGGMLMLAALAQLIPVKAIIPVHGVVQLGSNSGRTLVMFKDVRWRYVFWFSAGSFLGAAFGGKVVINLPIDILRILLGSFILFTVWGPKLNTALRNRNELFVGGVISTFLTMFIGATGPFVLALLRSFGLDRLSLLATSSACLVLQHAVKVITFGILGFTFVPYMSLIVLMVISGFVGTVVGKKILIRTDEKKFQYWLNVILSLLALRLLLIGLI